MHAVGTIPAAPLKESELWPRWAAFLNILEGLCVLIALDVDAFPKVEWVIEQPARAMSPARSALEKQGSLC